MDEEEELSDVDTEMDKFIVTDEHLSEEEGLNIKQRARP